MAIGHVVTRGYGNGTLVATIALVALRGYIAGAAVIPVVEQGTLRAAMLPSTTQSTLSPWGGRSELKPAGTKSTMTP